MSKNQEQPAALACTEPNSPSVRQCIDTRKPLQMPADSRSTNLNEAVSLPHNRGNARKFALLALVVVAAGGGFWLLGDRLSLHYIATQESSLQAYRHSYPFRAAFIAIAAYITIAGFSLPGGSVLTLLYGWYFGFWQALVIVSVGSTGGATFAFLMTRYFFQEWIQQKFARKLESVNEVFDREGAFYLFTLRLLPAVPFFVINAVMGLTKIRVFTFWWVSQLGMLPGTAAYVYAGSSVPSLKQLADEGVGAAISWPLLLAFAVLGLLPLVTKRGVEAMKPGRAI